jgi:type II secretion system protein N
MAEFALPGPLRLPWVRRLLAPLAFALTFLLMIYLTFPYDVLGQRIEHEAHGAGWDVSIGKLGPAGLLGLRARALSAKPHDAPPGMAPLELKLDRLDLHPRLLQLFLRQLAVVFAVEVFGGEGSGVVRFSSDPKAPGLSALQAEVGELDLKQIPPALAGGLELAGKLGLKCDLSSLQQLEAASGKLQLTLKGATILKGTLKLAEGMSFPAPKLALGELNGLVTIDRGMAKIEKGTLSGGDVEAEIDGTVKLKPLASLSLAEIHVKLRPKDAWLEANPLVKGSLGFLGPKGPDGYTFTLSGPLSRLAARPGR